MITKSVSRSVRIRLVVLLFAVLLNNIIWAVALPYNGGPDELDHYNLVKFIHDHRSLPLLGKDLPCYLMDFEFKEPVPENLSLLKFRIDHSFAIGHKFEIRNPYDRMPPLPYILSAVGMGMLPDDHAQESLLGARLLMILCGLGLSFLTWLASFYIWPDNDERALVLSLIHI